MSKDFSELSRRARNVLAKVGGIEPFDDVGLLRWWGRCATSRPTDELQRIRGCGWKVLREIEIYVGGRSIASRSDPLPAEFTSADIATVAAGAAGMIVAESCGLCRFWDGKGLCRRYPRAVSVDGGGWCGEYRCKEKA